MAKVKRIRTGGVYKVRKYYYARWMYAGKKHTVPTKCTSKDAALAFLDKQTARYAYHTEREKLEHIKAEIALVNKSEEDYLQRVDAVPFDKLIETVLNAKGFPLDPRSNQSKCYYYNAGFFVKWMQEKHPYLTHAGQVDDNIAREFAAYIREARGDCVHNVTIKVLRSTWNAIADIAHLKDNPWKRIKYVQRCETPTDTLSAEDFEKIRKESKKKIWSEVMFVLSSRYGMRESDACLRKWSDISPDGKTLSFVQHKLRRHGDKARITVPVCEELREVLSRVPKGESQYILPDMAARYLRSSHLVQTQLHRLMVRAGVDFSNASGKQSKGWHSLRVYAISKMLEVAPMATVQSISGHLRISQAQHYYRGDADKARRAIDSIYTEKARPVNSAEMRRVANGDAVIIPKKEYDRLLEIERLYKAQAK